MTMENDTMGFGGYGFLIIFILFIFLFNGGFGNMGMVGRNYGYNGCGGTSTCEAVKQEIVDSAKTQFLVEQTSRNTQEYLGNKIDFYAYQDLRDQLAQERAKNVALESRIYGDAKFGALEAQIQAMSCAMLKQPPVYGVGTSCNAIYAPIPNGCGC